MLSNLSQRERILAITAGVMLPLFVLLVGFFWFFNSLSNYDDQIATLTTKVNQAKALRVKALSSERRRQRYVALSLPSSAELAKVEYRQWLAGLAEDVFGANGYVLESIHGLPMRFNRNVGVGEKLSIKLNVASADLSQLNRFLYRFYEAPILQRVSSLTATPILAKTGPTEEMAPTGKMGILLQIEVLSLADAPRTKSIDETDTNSLARDLESYRNQIESRNIFGLPNNPPQITSSASPSEFEGRDLSLGINVRESDENDRLSFELLSSQIEGATLTQRDPTSRTAQFESSPLDPGTYKFKVRVTDSGFPPKSDEREFTLTIKDTPVEIARPESKFEHAQEAVVVAIVQNAGGIRQAWIHVRTLGETHKLGVGDAFELDGMSWKLVQLEPNGLTLEVNGKLKSYRMGDHLDQPRSASTIPAAANKPDSSLGG
jgi:hypothetical protein